MFRLVIVAVIVCATSGRKFQNPVLSDDWFRAPAALLHRGQYYAVTYIQNTESDKFAIQASSDLQNWNHAGYALPKNYIPTWSNQSLVFYNPEIHQIDESEFRLFFSAYSTSSINRVIGVGYSQTVLGPYIVKNQPLLGNGTLDLDSPTLVHDGARKYLIWRHLNDFIGRELNADCLDFLVGSEEKIIMKETLPWEAGLMESPWYVRRPDAWYMFYTGNSGSLAAVGVARSQDPLGPFEKHGDPILVSSYAFNTLGHCSVVPDIFIGATVMLYQATPTGINAIYMMSQSVEWGADGWPYMNPY